MQLFSRKKALFAASLVALGGLAACGDDVTVPVAPEPLPDPVVVTISPPNATMNVGEALTFAVQITGGNPTPTLASCTSSNTSVATAAVQGAGCRVSAVASGNVTITAATSAGQSAAAAVTVNTLPAAATGMLISPSAVALARGQTATLTAALEGARPGVTLGSLTQATSNSAVATATISGSNITITAVAPGTATITITGVASGAGSSNANVSAQVGVTVTEAPGGIAALTVQPTSLALALGSTAQLTAQVTQPTGAPQASITYGTSAPAIASVSSTGLVTALQPGTATITVTASSPAATGFSASSVTQLVPVTVSPSANVTIQTITQGPIKTTANDDGIITSANDQVNQPIDITNVRDQIQVVLNLQPNGQRVDSVVVFVANADGSNRRSAARQAFSNGTANAGDITLFLNTADFTVDWDNARAEVRFENGLKLISASVFTATGETQNAENNRQTVNFNNLDGWAAQYNNPTQSATRAQGTATSQTWWGGPGAGGRGNYTVVAVAYTPGRRVSTFRTNILQGPLNSVGSEVCVTVRGLTSRNVAIGESFGSATTTVTGARLTYDGSLGNASTTAGNGNIECGEYELTASRADSAFRNFPGVLSATDNSNNAYPRVRIPNGYRFSASVPQIVTNRLDYLGPSTQGYSNSSTQGGGFLNEPDIRRTVLIQAGVAPITGWINGEFSITGNTASNSDNGVGRLSSAAAQRATRQWFWYGCGRERTDAQPFDGTGAQLNECPDDGDARGGFDPSAAPTPELGIRTRGPYQVFYTEPDLLGNVSSSATRALVDGRPALISARFGVDKTPPVIRWSSSTDFLNFGAQDTIVVTAAERINALRAEFFDERSGFVDAGDASADNLAFVLDERTVTTLATAIGTNINATTSVLNGSGLDLPRYRAQQHFLSQAAGYLNAADFPTRGRCTVPTNGPLDATQDPNLQQYTNIRQSIAAGNTVRATGANIVTDPACRFWNALDLHTGPLGDGYRAGMPVSIPDAGIWRYSTRVYDRAGNVSQVLTRWVALDAPSSAPAANLAAPLSVPQGGDETFTLSFEDRSEVRGANLQVQYPGLPGLYLYYPKTKLDDRFNNTINAPGSRSLTTPNGNAFISALEFTLGGAVTPAIDIFKPLAARSTVFDIVGSTVTPTATILGTSLANPTDWSVFNTNNPDRAFNSFTVLPSLAPGFNAGEGLKAQVRANTNVINSPFTRVEFFRFQNGRYEYLGSSSTAIPGDGGTVRYWTYLLPNSAYANTPTSLEDIQRPAREADQILAIGVRSTGEGLATVGAIGGNIVNITVNGLPAGAPANITISNNSTGFTQTFTAAGTYVIPDGVNTYQISVGNTTFNNILYVGSGPATFTSNSQVSAFTVTYVANILQARANIVVDGTPGRPHTQVSTFPWSITGPNPALTVVGSGTGGAGLQALVTVPSAGNYDVNGAAGTYGSFSYTVAGTANVTVSAGVTGTGTITYTNTTNYVRLTVSGVPTGVLAGVQTTCGADPTVTENGNITERVITASASVVCTTVAPAFAFGGQWYFASPNSVTATTDGGASVINVAYAPVTPRIRITSTGSNLPNGLQYTVRVTSSAFASTGGFQDFTCITGSNCDITMLADGTVYNVSFLRRLDSNTQRWTVDAAGQVDITGAPGASVTVDAAPTGSVLVDNVTASTTPTTAVDVQRTIVITWNGPTTIP